jgi:gliding motility-associated lipoprotein GldH
MILFLHKYFSLKKPLLFVLATSMLFGPACSLPADVFEKDIVIPGQQWESSFRPRIDFIIRDEDTAFRYNVFLVLRHTDAYNYNNIWIKGTVREPGDTIPRSERYDLLLATNDKGWQGSGMDDIYEHRIQIQEQTQFKRPGTYSFMLEQIMREDPLKHVLNVGVRVEKVK